MSMAPNPNAPRFDVIGLGNAIMDILASVDDGFLADQKMEKGSMALIDQDRALSLDAALRKAGAGHGKVHTIAGGSAANTLVGIAELGLRAALIAKVGKDETGQALSDGYHAAGVTFATKPTTSGTASARCLIAVTPDAERTMNTFLGASVEFGEEDVVAEMIRASATLYLEGYLFDGDAAKRAFVKAAEIARAAGRTVALTLSDTFCVARHKDSFRHLVDHQCDIVFANEDELLALTGASSVDAGMDEIEREGLVLCVTRSSKGSVISDGKRRYFVPVVWAKTLVDTTGAGDQYAAGVLAGRAMGMDWPDAGYLGSLCAAEVIGHYGARPEMRVHDYALMRTGMHTGINSRDAE